MQLTNQFYIIKKALCLLICLAVLCNFNGGSGAKSGFEQNIAADFAQDFADGNSDSSESKENSKLQDLALNHQTYHVLKVSAKNSSFANHLPVSGFTLSIATPPPDFLG